MHALAGTLDGGRDVEGVTRPARTAAAWRHNFDVALASLRRKPAVPLDHLYSARTLAEGDGATLAALLNHLREAFPR